MKNAILFILICLLSISCTKEMIHFETIVEIDSNNQINSKKVNQLKSELLNRHDLFGAEKTEIINNKENQLTIRTFIEKEKFNNYESLFESNEFGIWKVYKNSDRIIQSIDSSLLNVEYFTPYFKNRNIPFESLGTTREKKHLKTILDTLNIRLGNISNFKLFWSKEMNHTEDYFSLYMIKTQRKNTAPLTEKNIVDARPTTDPITGEFTVQFSFDEDGKKIFGEMTRIASVNHDPLAMIYNNEVISCPRVQQAILGGECVLTGNLTIEESNEIVQSLRSERLPYPLKIVGQGIIPEEE